MASLLVNGLVSTKPAHCSDSLLSRGVKIHCRTHAQCCTILMLMHCVQALHKAHITASEAFHRRCTQL